MFRNRLPAALVLAVSCFFPATTYAQDADSSPNPVKWALKLPAAEPAKEFVLELTAEIEAGWHLYSTERVEGGPSPTRITIPAGQNLEIAGDIDSPAPRSAFDPNFQVSTEFYEGSVTFKIPIKAVTLITSSNKIRVQVRYQSCNSTICLPPKLQDIEATGGETQPDKAANSGDLISAGAKVPEFEFTDFNGKRRGFAEFRGQIVLLDFWASWCSPCLADIPELRKTYQQFHQQGFAIIGMNSEMLGQKELDAEFLKAGEAKAREIVGTRGVNWTQSINDTSLPIAKRFGVESLPAKILIDREGRFVRRINTISELQGAIGELQNIRTH